MARGMIFFGVIILIIALVAIYLTFFHYQQCSDISCWNAKLSVCEKAKYNHNIIDVTWQYTILGKKGDKCEVNVRVLDIKRGLRKSEILEDKEMVCEIPFGLIIYPESNTNNCHGRLKEEIQTLIIEKLHQYILDNVGELNKELLGIEGTNIISKVEANFTRNEND